VRFDSRNSAPLFSGIPILGGGGLFSSYRELPNPIKYGGHKKGGGVSILITTPPTHTQTLLFFFFFFSLSLEK
jgi:hypothetical protein